MNDLPFGERSAKHILCHIFKQARTPIPCNSTLLTPSARTLCCSITPPLPPLPPSSRLYERSAKHILCHIFKQARTPIPLVTPCCSIIPPLLVHFGIIHPCYFPVISLLTHPIPHLSLVLSTLRLSTTKNKTVPKAKGLFWGGPMACLSERTKDLG